MKGLAYGVFKCSDLRPKQELSARLRQALENIKLASDETGIPRETQFSVFGIQEGKVQVRVNGETAALIEMIEVLERLGANFMIISSLPNATNAITARDLGDVFNMLYSGTELFDIEQETGIKPVMDVFFRDESGRYISKIDMDAQSPPALLQ